MNSLRIFEKRTSFLCWLARLQAMNFARIAQSKNILAQRKHISRRKTFGLKEKTFNFDSNDFRKINISRTKKGTKINPAASIQGNTAF